MTRPWVPTSRKRRKRASRTDRYLSRVYAGLDELHWHSTRRGAFLSAMAGEHVNGARFVYDTPLDPGPIDAGHWCPYDPGGAAAYDDGTW